jgi:hypothetical protein
MVLLHGILILLSATITFNFRRNYLELAVILLSFNVSFKHAIEQLLRTSKHITSLHILMILITSVSALSSEEIERNFDFEMLTAALTAVLGAHRLLEVSKDHNCFFRAINRICSINDTAKNQEKLRERLVLFIKEVMRDPNHRLHEKYNSQEFKYQVLNVNISTKILFKRLQTSGKRAGWGGYQDLQFLADMLNYEFHHLTRIDLEITIQDTVKPTFRDANTKTAYLFLEHDHYWGITKEEIIVEKAHDEEDLDLEDEWNDAEVEYFPNPPEREKEEILPQNSANTHAYSKNLMDLPPPTELDPEVPKILNTGTHSTLETAEGVLTILVQHQNIQSIGVPTHQLAIIDKLVNAPEIRPPLKGPTIIPRPPACQREMVMPGLKETRKRARPELSISKIIYNIFGGFV